MVKLIAFIFNLLELVVGTIAILAMGLISGGMLGLIFVVALMYSIGQIDSGITEPLTIAFIVIGTLLASFKIFDHYVVKPWLDEQRQIRVQKRMQELNDITGSRVIFVRFR